MGHICYYTLKAKSKKLEDLERLCKSLTDKAGYKLFAGVFDFHGEISKEDGEYQLFGSGDCRQSIIQRKSTPICVLAQ